MTAQQAIDTAFKYGGSLAGLDGSLTKAIIAFKDDSTVTAQMLTALAVGYMMKKLDYTKVVATRAVAKAKYNEKKQDDDHRTFDEERVMVSVRVLWHRANKGAGIVKPKSENQVKAETERATKDAEKKAHQARLEETWEIVHPKDETDIFESLTRLVSTMKALQSKHSAKLVGDAGMTWRDWLASAPKVKPPKAAKAA
jgi:hypothetical protein